MTEQLLEKMEVEGIPDHMRSGLKFYILKGLPPGGFLRAVLSNDLIEAFGRADHINQHCVKNYVSFLYNYAPTSCWKSPENVTQWIKVGGLEGLQKQ